MAVNTAPQVVISMLPILGINLNRRTNITTEVQPIEHLLGTSTIDNSSRVWVYVHATTTGLGAGNSVTIIWGSGAMPGSVDASSVVAKTVAYYQCGSVAFAANDYGWVQSVKRIGLPVNHNLAP